MGFTHLNFALLRFLNSKTILRIFQCLKLFRQAQAREAVMHAHTFSQTCRLTSPLIQSSLKDFAGPDRRNLTLLPSLCFEFQAAHSFLYLKIFFFPLFYIFFSLDRRTAWVSHERKARRARKLLKMRQFSSGQILKL